MHKSSEILQSCYSFLHFMNILSSDSSHMETEAASPPHEALFLVLHHLPVFELLVMSEVCVSLRDAVMMDLLAWTDVIVEKPLHLRLTDEILMKITSKAEKKLRTLALMNCVKITDDGLHCVLEENPNINKLYVPACTGLTPEGIIKAVKKLSEKDNTTLKRLRIHGIYNMEKQHLESLHSLLQINPKQNHQNAMFANYAHNDFLTFRHQDCDRAIDLETCTKCSEVGLVFSCPREACKMRSECKGCKLCIPRCTECGGCIKVEEMEDAETVCGDDVCLECWFQLSKCNFCNKPYCRQHADPWCSSPHSEGFVCHVCHERFLQNLLDDME